MKQCKIDNCRQAQKRLRRDYCYLHYHRIVVLGNEESLCKVDSCGTAKKLRCGYCEKHYERFRRYGDPLGGGMFRSKRPPACTAGGCTSVVVARALCSKHYARLTKHGDINGGKFHHSDRRRRWHVNDGGYVVRHEPSNPNACPNGIVYQHRHVMSEMLGRPLCDGENVHHKNGDRADNRPDNLELWIVGQPAGQRAVDVVAWAREILATYGDLVDRMADKRPQLRAV